MDKNQKGFYQYSDELRIEECPCCGAPAKILCLDVLGNQYEADNPISRNEITGEWECEVCWLL